MPPALTARSIKQLSWRQVARDVARQVLCRLFDGIACLSRTHPGATILTSKVFAPVREEVHETNLQVEGVIPNGLEGAYMRTGPNPYFAPVAGYHLFDGDGMVHVVKLEGGKARSYANHWVRTNRLKQEMANGKALILKLGDMYGLRGLILVALDLLKRPAGVWSDEEGKGTANTGVVYHHGRVIALHEYDLPYQLFVREDGTLQTVGRIRIGGTGGQPVFPGPFTAHPKIDPCTDELFFFGHELIGQPFYMAGIMDSNGNVMRQWKVKVPFACMAHDCSLTANYAILLNMPMVLKPTVMVKDQQLPVVFDSTRPARVGLLRRDHPGSAVALTDPAAEPANVQWFELPASYTLHVANSWEDSSGKVHVITCHFKSFSMMGIRNKIGEPAPPEEERGKLFEYVLDPATGTATLTQLGDEYVDYPVVNPHKACYQSRYVWGGTPRFWLPAPQMMECDGIVKYDLSAAQGEKCVARIQYPDHWVGGEASFAPRPGATEEDDGWLLVFVYDSKLDQSALHIYDAQTMNNTPLARIITSQRVPFGFHGMFVTKEQLKKQPGSL